MERFDDIRPYRDNEIADAMKRISASQHFPAVCGYVYPDRDINDVRDEICGYSAVRQFQYSVMKAFNEQVIKRSIGSFSFSGVENIPRDKACLYVSNHRDIVLDACLMQYILYLNDIPTTEITFGANLMNGDFVVDIGKSNKMFRVERGGTPKEFYQNSLRLSEYLHHTICENGESIWIAQRNGRTKDGIDRTNPAIIRMFVMCSEKTPAQALAGLSIVPVSVSYQWEPCDFLKAYEVYMTERDGAYVKKKGEDLNSILTGIMQQKGDFHMHFGAPLTYQRLQPLVGLPLNRFSKEVSQILDKEINGNYRPMTSNYIAADILESASNFRGHYTETEREAFLKRMDGLGIFDVEMPERLRQIYLGIYANPVKNRGLSIP